MFLLDTVAISEMERPNPNAGLVEWLTAVEWSDLYLSVITVAEIHQGIRRMPTGKKRRALEAAFDLLPDRFPGRILTVDFATAVRYGEIEADCGPLPILDTLLGATAFVHRLTVVTRNTSDIGRTGVRVHDPWT